MEYRRMENCTQAIFQMQLSVQLLMLMLLSGILVLLSSLLTSRASSFSAMTTTATVRRASYLGLCTLQQLQQCHIQWHCKAKMLSWEQSAQCWRQVETTKTLAIQKPMKTVAKMRGQTRQNKNTQRHIEREMCWQWATGQQDNRTAGQRTAKQQLKNWMKWEIV